MFLHIEQRISNKNRRQIGFWNRDLNSFIFFFIILESGYEVGCQVVGEQNRTLWRLL